MPRSCARGPFPRQEGEGAASPTPQLLPAPWESELGQAWAFFKAPNPSSEFCTALFYGVNALLGAGQTHMQHFPKPGDHWGRGAARPQALGSAWPEVSSTDCQRKLSSVS